MLLHLRQLKFENISKILRNIHIKQIFTMAEPLEQHECSSKPCDHQAIQPRSIQTGMLRVEFDHTYIEKYAVKSPETLENWPLPLLSTTTYAQFKNIASQYMRKCDIPVAFPTETVYGLGADATRSDAVKGIYAAKGRPSDNPLIIHICDLKMLRSLLLPDAMSLDLIQPRDDPIPAIYRPLIRKFWPGPLTIILRNPPNSKLAPEVTAGLKTFGVRMPDSVLARTLISLARVPIAAPSANASTKPSTTTAMHVFHDLRGKIEIILDGGQCQVGVESTIVDGLCDPPVMLRPGGLSLEDIRSCKGWENTIKGYKDESELGSEAPRAPGMKYKHYSPTAKVILYESGCSMVRVEDIAKATNGLTHGADSTKPLKVAIIRTKQWSVCGGLGPNLMRRTPGLPVICAEDFELQPLFRPLQVMTVFPKSLFSEANSDFSVFVEDVDFGTDTAEIAHQLFLTLRSMDLDGVDVICIEGIDGENDLAAAVMNRLRKAAAIIRYPSDESSRPVVCPADLHQNPPHLSSPPSKDVHAVSS